MLESVLIMAGILNDGRRALNQVGNQADRIIHQAETIIVERDLKKFGKWKTKLSGAFENEQLMVSFVVLGMFYIGYLAESFASGSNNKDEDDINKNCSCTSKRRIFYILWFALCCLLWFILHTIVFTVKLWPKCLENTKSAICSCIKQCCCGKKKNASNNENKAATLSVNKKYETYLWIQYYKLYIVGYFKNEGKIKLFNESGNHNEDKNKNDDNFCWLKNLIYALLLIFQYIAQLGAIPLLIVQMFDTYTLLCFGADTYCSDSDEYKLSIHQAVVTFAFYCCLGISLLTTALIKWDPWPSTD